MRKRLVISASMRFRDVVKKTIADFAELDIEGIFPNLDCSLENRDVARTIEEKRRFAEEHFEAMRVGDGVYLIVPGGYVGTSGKIEVGYALALNKPLYFSEITGQQDVDCFAKEIIPLDNLKRFKEVL